jgi:hypothetical protein
MIRTLALTVAATAVMAAVSTADSAECGDGYTKLGGEQCFARVAYLAPDDDDDADYGFDDGDGDGDEDTTHAVTVDDIEDCAPGKFYTVEFGDNLDVLVACH